MVRLKVSLLPTLLIVYGFQFHYGTIKRTKALVHTITIYVYFNSTMVRLKVRYRQDAHSVLSFQFHYGTIKSFALVYACSFAASFQFHYGTIKRIKKWNKELDQKEFQFHYGTIKSFCLVNVVTLVEYFNSTMVRLKVWWNYVLPFDS